jgi:hypothetical protein
VDLEVQEVRVALEQVEMVVQPEQDFYIQEAKVLQEQSLQAIAEVVVVEVLEQLSMETMLLLEEMVLLLLQEELQEQRLQLADLAVAQLE